MTLSEGDKKIRATDEGTDPVCWVCGTEAKHVSTKPPYEYGCDEHSFDIDMVPIEGDQR